MVKNAFTPPAECPVCGESVPPNARACPGCGADERSGWDEEATRHDGLDLPDPAGDDATRAPAPRATNWLWTVVGLLALAALMAAFLFR